MKATYFKSYMELLKTDRSAAEHAAWAIMQMTEKQICKIIDFYIENGLYEIKHYPSTTHISFGLFSYPIEDYRKHGKYDIPA